MAYSFVKNVLNIPNEDGSIDDFIKITTLSEFSLYEFLMKIQLLKTENFYQYTTCIDLQDVLTSNIEQINAELISLTTEYMFLGDISFNVRVDNSIGSLVIDLDIKLNEKISGLDSINTSLKIK